MEIKTVLSYIVTPFALQRDDGHWSPAYLTILDTDERTFVFDLPCAHAAEAMGFAKRLAAGEAKMWRMSMMRELKHLENRFQNGGSK